MSIAACLSDIGDVNDFLNATPSTRSPRSQPARSRLETSRAETRAKHAAAASGELLQKVALFKKWMRNYTAAHTDASSSSASHEGAAELFAKFDKDGGGTLSQDELRQASRRGGITTEKLSDRDLQRIFRQIDVDDGGEIEIAELLKYVWDVSDGQEAIANARDNPLASAWADEGEAMKQPWDVNGDQGSIYDKMPAIKCEIAARLSTYMSPNGDRGHWEHLFAMYAQGGNMDKTDGTLNQKGLDRLLHHTALHIQDLVAHEDMGVLFSSMTGFAQKHGSHETEFTGHRNIAHGGALRGCITLKQFATFFFGWKSDTWREILERKRLRKAGASKNQMTQRLLDALDQAVAEGNFGAAARLNEHISKLCATSTAQTLEAAKQTVEQGPTIEQQKREVIKQRRRAELKLKQARLLPEQRAANIEIYECNEKLVELNQSPRGIFNDAKLRRAHLYRTQDPMNLNDALVEPDVEDADDSGIELPKQAEDKKPAVNFVDEAEDQSPLEEPASGTAPPSRSDTQRRAFSPRRKANAKTIDRLSKAKSPSRRSSTKSPARRMSSKAMAVSNRLHATSIASTTMAKDAKEDTHSGKGVDQLLEEAMDMAIDGYPEMTETKTPVRAPVKPKVAFGQALPLHGVAASREIDLRNNLQKAQDHTKSQLDASKSTRSRMLQQSRGQLPRSPSPRRQAAVQVPRLKSPARRRKSEIPVQRARSPASRRRATATSPPRPASSTSDADTARTPTRQATSPERSAAQQPPPLDEAFLEEFRVRPSSVGRGRASSPSRGKRDKRDVYKEVDREAGWDYSTGGGSTVVSTKSGLRIVVAKGARPWRRDHGVKAKEALARKVKEANDATERKLAGEAMDRGAEQAREAAQARLDDSEEEWSDEE